MAPTKADLEAARNATIEDVLGPGLDVLFCGINPSLYSAATGHHFARPGNRFWPALHLSGLVPHRLAPSEQHLLPAYGLGITNIVARATARADELAPEELRVGGERLARLVAEVRPRVLAIAGVSAYRVAFARPAARIGPQEDAIGGTALWVLPNSSGLNAHWRLEDIAAEMARLRPSRS
ncbi:UNVERIFIED_ORG: TDG/mug DNA glycosylase family protein [Microbispora rosea subsp. rosea]